MHDSRQLFHPSFARLCASPALRRGLLLALLSLTIPVSSNAALGGDVNSVLADQIQLQGSLTRTQMGSFEVHEIRPQAQSTGQNGVKTGTVIREYVSPAGTVFAVTWKGEWPPNMRQLLGPYFPQYVEAVKAQVAARPGRRPMQIVGPDFVVENNGHMRSYSGRAYLPGMLPPGVQPEAIQ